MIEYIRSLRGVNDYLPKTVLVWQYVENLIKKILDTYGYKEIRLPILEEMSLFNRIFGEKVNSLVREIYSFKDRSNRYIALRPEGTISCTRVSIINNLINCKEQRLWYMGPMFRYERPQKGRYRQFYQIGAEVLGLPGPDIDAEVIKMTDRFWKSLGVSKYVVLEINSIGSLEDRTLYCSELINFLRKHKKYLDIHYKNRINNNPLRILDSKDPSIQELLNDAPKLEDFLSEDSHKHFNALKFILEEYGIVYRINQRLVRGLDYYNYTVFEWITDKLGSQNAICGGGRYDNLVSRLSNKVVPGFGFAIGMDRLVLLMKTVNPNLVVTDYIDIYVIILERSFQTGVMVFIEKLRDLNPELKILIGFNSFNIKNSITKANTNKARLVLIFGKDEIATHKVTIKDLYTAKQQTIKQDQAINLIRKIIDND